MKILEDLWYGILIPRTGHQKRLKDETHLVSGLKNDDTMRAMLSDIQKEQYEKLHNCQDGLTNLLELKAFADGFCLAVKIMVNVMNTMQIPSIDD